MPFIPWLPGQPGKEPSRSIPDHRTPWSHNRHKEPQGLPLTRQMQQDQGAGPLHTAPTKDGRPDTVQATRDADILPGHPPLGEIQIEVPPAPAPPPSRDNSLQTQQTTQAELSILIRPSVVDSPPQAGPGIPISVQDRLTLHMDTSLLGWDVHSTGQTA